MSNTCHNTLIVDGDAGAVERFTRANTGSSDHPLTFLRAVPLNVSYSDADARTAWGTPRDAKRTRATHYPSGAVYSFETAWCPPVLWLKAVSAQHPRLTMLLRYTEWDMHVVGELVVRGGDVRDEYVLVKRAQCAERG
jgi:hypothetical protein